MFPWESVYTGYEVCPGEIYGKNQNHITGDIAFAVKQYWMATGDIQWMKNKGFQIVYETAKFWISRSKYETTKQRYVIDDVMPPDEYNYPANNSVYTNIVAKINIKFALELGKLLGRHVPTAWKKVADGLFIPFDKVNNYHPEFEGFKKTDKVKQADAILIGYPLMYEMSKEVRKNDLDIYGNITNPKGPAMTHSMFSIGWLEIDETEKAALALYKNYGNIIGPFHVWSEIIGGKGATNFITAAGGFLQAIMFGYGGLRLKSDGLHFNGQLPPKISKMSFNGLDYQGNAIDIDITENNLVLNVTQQSPTAKKLVLFEGKRIVTLIPGKLYSVKSKHGSVSVFKTKRLRSAAPSLLDRTLKLTILQIAFIACMF